MDCSKEFYIPTGSEAEEYFLNELKPNCKDRMTIDPGYHPKDSSESYTRYEITLEDYYRIRAYIMERDGVK